MTMEELKSSPFISRLDSNYVATESESLEIQNLLKGATAHLEDLTIRLQELNEQVTQIQNEQTSLSLLISKHRGFISQVRKLPLDIMQQIFIACLPTAHNSVMSKREPPMLLTQVCSTWRTVAHATPCLWKSLHIAIPCTSTQVSGMYPSECPNFRSMGEQLAHRRSEALLEWLNRSALCLLDISLDLSELEHIASDGFCEKIMDHLIHFSERWKHVSISAPHQALRLVAALPASKVPSLESLSLNCNRLNGPNGLDHQSIWQTGGVMRGPKLRGLYLTQLDEDTTRLPINWSQLTTLSLEGTTRGTTPSLSASMAYKILSSCRNLVSCRLEVGPEYQSLYDEEPLPSLLETSTAIIPLPFLTKLSIREGFNLSKLFTLLHLPSLNSLEFHTKIWLTEESRTGLPTLLMSHGIIEHLLIDARFFKRKDFINCLRLCPFLKSLVIRQSHMMRCPPPRGEPPFCRMDDELLNMFTSSTSSDEYDDGSNGDDNDEASTGLEGPIGCLCPNLELFDVSIGASFSETALLQFVKRKNDDGESSILGLTKLKILFVVFQRPPLIDIYPELESYIQAGLDAKILYPHLPPRSPFFSPYIGLPGRIQSGYWPFC